MQKGKEFQIELKPGILLKMGRCFRDILPDEIIKEVTNFAHTDGMILLPISFL